MDREKMISLYQNMSKHSGYQILPEEIQQYLGVDVKTLSRFERERLEYIKKHIDLNDKKVMDIGGNTGYFTFNSIKSGAVHVDYYEGNAVHAEFVEHGKEIYNTERITVFNKYYSFEPTVAEYDLIFCMNVVHHLGDDFFCVKTLEEAKREMMQCVNNLAFSAAVLVFQMGFNWMGNIQKPLFKNGTKKEMIDYIFDNTKEFWNIEYIGIAERDEQIHYREKSEENIRRDDSLGEFLNRPIFIMSSKNRNKEGRNLEC